MPRSFRTQAAFRGLAPEKPRISETVADPPPLQDACEEPRHRLQGSPRRSSLLRLDRRRPPRTRRGQLHRPLHTSASPRASGARSTSSPVAELEAAGLMHASGLAAFRPGAARKTLPIPTRTDPSPSTQRPRSSFEPTRLPGNSFKPGRPGTVAPSPSGSRAPNAKKPVPNITPSSSTSGPKAKDPYRESWRGINNLPLAQRSMSWARRLARVSSRLASLIQKAMVQRVPRAAGLERIPRQPCWPRAAPWPLRRG